MTKYNVHIYREMRLFFPGVEAASPEEAARVAAGKPTDEAEYSEDCDGENLAALIDVVGDDGFTLSQTVDFEPERHRKMVPELLEALTDLLGDLPSVQHGQCIHCGREYHDIEAGACPSDDCPSFKARAAIANAKAKQPEGRQAEAGMTLTNQKRSNRCQEAIAAYTDDDTYTNLVDFLADAMHWCHLNEHSFQDALNTATMHFEAETMGDDITDELHHQPSTERK